MNSDLWMRNAAVSLGGRMIFENATFELPRGETMAILGPNGRGQDHAFKGHPWRAKATLGRTSGPQADRLCAQSQHGSESHSCLDLVLMARAAQLGMFSLPSRHDRRLAMEAMEQVGAARFADRLYGTFRAESGRSFYWPVLWPQVQMCLF